MKNRNRAKDGITDGDAPKGTTTSTETDLTVSSVLPPSALMLFCPGPVGLIGSEERIQKVGAIHRTSRTRRPASVVSEIGPQEAMYSRIRFCASSKRGMYVRQDEDFDG